MNPSSPNNKSGVKFIKNKLSCLEICIRSAYKENKSWLRVMHYLNSIFANNLVVFCHVLFLVISDGLRIRWRWNLSRKFPFSFPLHIDQYGKWMNVLGIPMACRLSALVISDELAAFPSGPHQDRTWKQQYIALPTIFQCPVHRRWEK